MRTVRCCSPMLHVLVLLDLLVCGMCVVPRLYAADSAGRLITSRAIAVDPGTHKVYAVNEGENTVVVTDGRTGKSRPVAVGVAPIALAILPALHRVYVVNGGSNSISVMDEVSDQVIATLPAGSHPYTLMANATTGKVYVTYTYDHILTEIDGRTETTRAIETGSADGIEIDEKTNVLFLMTYEDPMLRIVNPATGTVEKVEVGAHIWGMVFDAKASRLYLAHTVTADVTRLDERTHQLTRVAVGQIPCALALDPANGMLYAVNYGDETLSIINLASFAVVRTVALGDHPQAVLVDPRANRVYVANVHGNSVSVLDGGNGRFIGTLTAGEHPYDLAVDLELGHAYAAVYGAKASVLLR